MDRREFLGMGACAAALAAGGCVSVGGSAAASGGGRRNCPFRIGVAGYTLVKFSLDESLKLLQKWGVSEFCAKSFHYPMTASASELKALVRKTADFGVHLYGAGPITTKSEDDAKRAFEYCANLGVPTVVGVPAEVVDESKGWAGLRTSRRMCEVCARLADEYKMDFAIHNHGANPKTGNPNLYPTVEGTAKVLEGLSPRIGLCVDIAYTHADGFDAAEVLKRNAARVFDVHLRNIAIADNGSSGAAADAGLIDYVRVFRALKDIGYSRVCGLELANAYGEQNEANPGADPSWVPRSLGYFRGLADAV